MNHIGNKPPLVFLLQGLAIIAAVLGIWISVRSMTFGHTVYFDGNDVEIPIARPSRSGAGTMLVTAIVLWWMAEVIKLLIRIAENGSAALVISAGSHAPANELLLPSTPPQKIPVRPVSPGGPPTST